MRQWEGYAAWGAIFPKGDAFYPGCMGLGCHGAYEIWSGAAQNLPNIQGDWHVMTTSALLSCVHFLFQPGKGSLRSGYFVGAPV